MSNKALKCVVNAPAAMLFLQFAPEIRRKHGRDASAPPQRLSRLDNGGIDLERTA